MLTQEEDVEIHALRERGWTISEIARHIGRDRKTVRAYLAGERQPGVRVSEVPDPFDRIEAYVRQRLADDHGVWATVLFDEVQALGMPVRIRRSPASCVSGTCGCIAKPVRG
jgi:transposase